MIRLLLPSTLVSLMFHGFPIPGDAAAILLHRSSGGNGTGYWGKNPNPYSNPYSPYPAGYGSSGASGAGQPYSGGSSQPQNPNPWAAAHPGGYSSSGAGQPYSGGSGRGPYGQPQNPNPYSSNPGGYSSSGAGQRYGGGSGQPQNPNPWAAAHSGGYSSSGAGRPYSGGVASGYYGQSSNPYPPYSGGQSSSGAGQSYSGKGKQPAYDPSTGGQGFAGGAPSAGDKRPADESPIDPPRRRPTVEIAGDEMIRKYEVPGREIYNAWLMADTPEAASQLMLRGNALGPDPRNRNWQRHGIQRALTTAEWTITDTTSTLGQTNLLDLKNIVRPLQVGTEPNARWRSRRLRNVNVEPYDGNNPRTTGANIRVKMEQNKPYRPGGHRSRATVPALGGYYETVINIIDGVIIAEQHQDLYQQWSMRTADSLPLKDLPWDATWSDATWYLWVSMRGERLQDGGHKADGIPFKTSSTGNPFEYIEPRIGWNELQLSPRTPRHARMGNFLNYIFVTNIQDTDTLAILLRCTQSRGFGDLTFYIGHWCFYALLGTNANHMVAEFLAQHAGETLLGHKVLMSATIHNSVNIRGQRGPAIQWTVSDDVNGAYSRMRALEQQWLPPVNQRNSYCYPDIGNGR